MPRIEDPAFMVSRPITRSMGRERPQKIKTVQVDKTGLAHPQQPRLEDRKHLDFIRSLPCCVCGHPPQNHAHHVRWGLAGGEGYKPGDDRTAPLCQACHRTLHDAGEKWYWQHLGIDPFRLTKWLYERTDNEEAALQAIAQCRPRGRD